MALVTTKEMFKKAYAGGYAIGAFNINNKMCIRDSYRVVRVFFECFAAVI